MYVLGIETATSMGSVAIAGETGLVGECTLHVRTTHSNVLVPTLDQLLRGSGLGLDAIDAVAISLGPGSFTGVRIGLSTAKGLALATHKPLVGIGTLDALAGNICCGDALICPMIDARKKEVYTALYRLSGSGPLQKCTPDLVMQPESVLGMISGEAVFLGEGSVLYRERIEQMMGARAFFAAPHLNHPRAAAIALLGLEKVRQGDFLDARAATPVYVRPADAELKRDITKEAFKNRGLIGG